MNTKRKLLNKSSHLIQSLDRRSSPRKARLLRESIEIDNGSISVQALSPSDNNEKIKYKNELYSINDCLLIRDPLVKDGYLIAKLLQIIPKNGIEKYPYWPAIQVQWYLSLK